MAKATAKTGKATAKKRKTSKIKPYPRFPIISLFSRPVQKLLSPKFREFGKKAFILSTILSKQKQSKKSCLRKKLKMWVLSEAD